MVVIDMKPKVKGKLGTIIENFANSWSIERHG